MSTWVIMGRMSSIPEDLAVWRRLQDARQPNPLSESLRFPADGERPAALDTGYLTDEDRANPDIAASTRAMEETTALITWVAENVEEGVAFGYWRGPGGLPLDAAPVVALDTEGQLELLRGATLSEALVDEYGQWSHEDYTALVAECRSRGVAISADDPDDLLEPDVTPTPSEHHEARYRELLGGD
ncbi:hypothetical protein [Aeromicrobium sp. Sec7.5]|uniref:hypothetical protein n=1 Tax=Aeromicrobium sp. Sec7.5 TaxID=3121276 RepID=UPI002FE495DA